MWYTHRLFLHFQWPHHRLSLARLGHVASSSDVGVHNLLASFDRGVMKTVGSALYSHFDCIDHLTMATNSRALLGPKLKHHHSIWACAEIYILSNLGFTCWEPVILKVWKVKLPAHPSPPRTRGIISWCRDLYLPLTFDYGEAQTIRSILPLSTDQNIENIRLRKIYKRRHKY